MSSFRGSQTVSVESFFSQRGSSRRPPCFRFSVRICYMSANAAGLAGWGVFRAQQGSLGGWGQWERKRRRLGEVVKLKRHVEIDVTAGRTFPDARPGTEGPSRATLPWDVTHLEGGPSAARCGGSRLGPPRGPTNTVSIVLQHMLPVKGEKCRHQHMPEVFQAEPGSQPAATHTHGSSRQSSADMSPHSKSRLVQP